MKNKKLFTGLIGGTFAVAVTFFATSIAIACSSSNNLNLTLEERIERMQINLAQELKKITIDNFGDFFEGANNKPDKLNTGKMSKQTFAKLAGISSDEIESFTVTKAEEKHSDNGFLRLNFSVKLVNYNEKIELNDILTGMYDPNCQYNKEFFEIVTDTKYYGKNWLLSKIYKERISSDASIYVPWDVNLIKFNYWSGDVPPKLPNAKIDARFSQMKDIPVSGLRNSDFKEIDFSGLSTFTFQEKNTNGIVNNANGLREIVSLQRVNFSNTAITNLPIGLFYGDTNLREVIFTGCTSLREIGLEAFYGCTSIETLDFSSSTFERIESNVFIGCTGLRTIYCKDQQSKDLLVAAVNNAELSNCQVVIKN